MAEAQDSLMTYNQEEEENAAIQEVIFLPTQSVAYTLLEDVTNVASKLAQPSNNNNSEEFNDSNLLSSCASLQTSFNFDYDVDNLLKTWDLYNDLHAIFQGKG